MGNKIILIMSAILIVGGLAISTQAPLAAVENDTLWLSDEDNRWDEHDWWYGGLGTYARVRR